MEGEEWSGGRDWREKSGVEEGIGGRRVEWRKGLEGEEWSGGREWKEKSGVERREKSGVDGMEGGEGKEERRGREGRNGGRGGKGDVRVEKMEERGREREEGMEDPLPPSLTHLLLEVMFLSLVLSLVVINEIDREEVSLESLSFCVRWVHDRLSSGFALVGSCCDRKIIYA